MHEHPCSSPSASDPGPLRLLSCSLSVSLAVGTRALSFLNLLGSLSVREAGSHAQTSARTLPGILGATVTVLLILGAGLWLWKMRGKKKKMETGRGRWLLSSQPSHLPSPIVPYMLSFSCILLLWECPRRGESGCGHDLGVHSSGGG